jgi:cardiolipin synthase (CMP-forming)
MTTANKITIGRILLVPFFVVQTIYYTRTGDEVYRFAALILFALTALSDGLDGYIARRYNQRSELGAILDPLADKTLLIAAIILLSRDSAPHFERIPIWLTATILSRDLILIIGVIVIHYTFGKVKVRPRMIGKVATVQQMAAVLWILLHWDKDFLPWLTVSAALFTAISGLLYIWDGVRQLSNHPASSPSKTND